MAAILPWVSVDGGLLQRVKTALRQRWLRATLRGAERKDAHTRVGLAYVCEDPWGMASDREQHRFRETARLLHGQVLGGARAERILEIACGEGHQSQHLARHCDHLTGVDISRLAVERARARVPHAELLVGELAEMPWADERHRFDVVTAFEVLYFVKDVEATLDRMSRVGKICMVSWFDDEAQRIAGPVLARGVDGTATIRHGDVSWTVAWWRNG